MNFIKELHIQKEKKLQKQMRLSPIHRECCSGKRFFIYYFVFFFTFSYTMILLR